MKEYWVVRFNCYADFEGKFQDLLNEAAGNDWELNTIFYQPGKAVAAAILERQVEESLAQQSRRWTSLGEQAKQERHGQRSRSEREVEATSQNLADRADG